MHLQHGRLDGWTSLLIFLASIISVCHDVWCLLMHLGMCNDGGRLIGNLFAWQHTVVQAFAEKSFAVNLRSWQCLYTLEIPKSSLLVRSPVYQSGYRTWLGGSQVC